MLNIKYKVMTWYIEIFIQSSHEMCEVHIFPRRRWVDVVVKVSPPHNRQHKFISNQPVNVVPTYGSVHSCLQFLSEKIHISLVRLHLCLKTARVDKDGFLFSCDNKMTSQLGCFTQGRFDRQQSSSFSHLFNSCCDRRLTGCWDHPPHISNSCDDGSPNSAKIPKG